jgi:hypothetical protein
LQTAGGHRPRVAVKATSESRPLKELLDAIVEDLPAGVGATA